MRIGAFLFGLLKRLEDDLAGELDVEGLVRADARGSKEGVDGIGREKVSGNRDGALKPGCCRSLGESGHGCDGSAAIAGNAQGG